MKQKEKKPFSRIGRLVFIVLSIALALLLALCAALYVYLSATVDTEEDLTQFALARGSRVTRLYYDATEGDDTYVPLEWQEESLTGSEKRIWTELEDMPSELWQAFVAIEDKRFFRHHGVDILRTGKAAANYFLGFDGQFGGSSITQQLMKNLTGEKKRTPMRKLREIYRALSIERACSKHDILELYLNIVPMGHNLSGVGAAAEAYFGKKPSELTLAEAASLAAITNSPVRYDLYRHGEANKSRRALIYRAMQEAGYLSESERMQAEREELQLQDFDRESGKVHSWYTEQVISDVTRDLVKRRGMTREAATSMVYNGGISIYTCIEPKVQSEMERYFEADGRFGEGNHYAMTVISARTGALAGIIGREGNKDANRILNYATVKRPPGSAIKPLSLYAPALEAGIISYSSVFDDVPVSFHKTENGYRPWPYNYPKVYRGLCDMPDAVAYSKNTVAVRVYDLLGRENCYDYLVNKMKVGGIVRAGVNEKGKEITDMAAAPLALGQLTYGASLVDLTAAYGVFLEGEYREPVSYTKVYDGLGRLILQNEVKPERVISKQNAFIMTKLLENVTDYGTASKITLADRIETAGKTGTSSGDRDRLFIGYTPFYVAGIRCTADGEHEVGATSPDHLSAWNTVMQSVHESCVPAREAHTGFPMPSGIYRAVYCRDSGKLPCEACGLDPRGDRIAVGYFTKETIPTERCHRHTEFLYDDEGAGVVLNGLREGARRISLLRIEERDFPMQILITDAQYVCRELHGAPPAASDGAYFESTMQEGHYAGISAVRGRQFNALAKPPALDFEDIPLIPGGQKRKNRRWRFFSEL